MASIYGDTARGPMSPFFFDKIYEATDTLDPAGDEVMVGRYVLQRKSGAQPDEYSGVVYQKVYLNNEYSYTPIMTLTSPSISFGNVDYQWRDDASGRETYTQYSSEEPPQNTVVLNTRQGSTVTYTFDFYTEGLGEAIKQMWNMVGGTGTQVGTGNEYRRNLDTNYYNAGDININSLNFDKTTLVGSINSLHKALGFLFKTATSTSEIKNNTDFACQYIYQVGTEYYIKLGNGFGGYVVKKLTGNLNSLYGTLLYLWSLIGSDTETSYDTIKGCINAFNNLFDGLTGITFAQGENNDITISMEANGVNLANLKIQNTDGSNIIDYVGDGREHTITINGGIGTGRLSQCYVIEVNSIDDSTLTPPYYNVKLNTSFIPTTSIPQNSIIYYGTYNSTTHKFNDTNFKDHYIIFSGQTITPSSSSVSILTITDPSAQLDFISYVRNHDENSTVLIIPDIPQAFGSTGNYIIWNEINRDKACSAIGYYTACVDTLGQHVIGRYNETNSNAIFQVGNGNATTRNNAFEVLQNGTVLVSNVDETNTKSAVTIGYLNEHSGTSNRSKGSFDLNGIAYYYTVDAGIRFDIWCKIQEYVNTSALNNHNDSHAIDFPWDESIGQSQNINMNSIGVQVCLDSSGDNQNLFEYCGAPFGEITDDNKLVYGAVIARYDELKEAYPRSSGNTTYIKYNVHITGQFKDLKTK